MLQLLLVNEWVYSQYEVGVVLGMLSSGSLDQVDLNYTTCNFCESNDPIILLQKCWEATWDFCYLKKLSFPWESRRSTSMSNRIWIHFTFLIKTPCTRGIGAVKNFLASS